MPMSPMKPVYAYTTAPTPPSRNGVMMTQDTMETHEVEILKDGSEEVVVGEQKDNESAENVREKQPQPQEGGNNISSEQTDL